MEFIYYGVLSDAEFNEAVALDDITTWRDVGHVAELTLSASEEVKKLPNLRTASGGSRRTIRRLDEVSINVTFNDDSSENLATLLWGEFTTATGVDTIQPFTQIAPTRVYRLVGGNSVDGTPHTIYFYRGRVGIPSNIALLSQDFGAMQVTIALEEDERVTGAGLSKYMKIVRG